jgi:hypothetical protein
MAATIVLRHARARSEFNRRHSPDDIASIHHRSPGIAIAAIDADSRCPRCWQLILEGQQRPS